MASWEGVSEFVAVAESASFTGAAKKLNTSVAQVSRRVSALEERIAVKLFNRTTRKVTLTEAGQVYFEQCKLLVEGLELAELAVTDLQAVPKGKIKVTAPVTYGEMHVAPLLSEFLLRYPQIDLDLELTNQTVDLIEAGFDVAIRLGRLGDSSLVAKRLGSRQLYVCASPDYIQKYGAPHTLSELGLHQCLVSNMAHWRFRQKGSEKSVRVSGRIKTNSGFVLLNAAKRGLGLIQLPDYYVQSGLESGELVEVLKEFRDEREGIWALYPQNRNLSPKVRLLIDFLAEHMAD